MGLFEALKFMKLMGVMAEKIWESPLSGSGWEWHSHDGWSSQIATVPSKFATGAVCNAAQCWARQQWWRRSRYKRHNFGFWDWDRMAWAPELQPRPKWYQMIAISPLCLERAQTESAVRGLFIHEMLRNHCYSALKYVISCGLHSKIGAAQKTFCLFSYTFFHYKTEQRGRKQREEF